VASSSCQTFGASFSFAGGGGVGFDGAGCVGAGLTVDGAGAGVGVSVTVLDDAHASDEASAASWRMRNTFMITLTAWSVVR
jgi:hypothetical protein